MGALTQVISTVSASGELNVGPSGNVMAVCSAIGTSFTASVQVNIDGSWQNDGATFSAVNTLQRRIDIPPGAAVRINVTAIVGAATFKMIT